MHHHRAFCHVQENFIQILTLLKERVLEVGRDEMFVTMGTWSPYAADGYDLYWTWLVPLACEAAAKVDWSVLFRPRPRHDRS